MLAATYGDIPLGLYLVRGDSVVLLGEVDPERQAAENLTKVSPEVGQLSFVRGAVGCDLAVLAGGERWRVCEEGREGRGVGGPT